MIHCSIMLLTMDKKELFLEAETTVLIRGESGTGKELIASAIHYNSARKDRPLIKVNCAALSDSMLEQELFGHEKGAITSISFKRIGRIEEAEGGTLFLDELGDFSSSIQIKFLRLIKEHEYERIGSNTPIKANIRVIVVTNRNLEDAVSEKRFRDDLYYSINVFPITLPPLRERRTDILLLANHFVSKYSHRMGKSIKRISTSAINMLMTYHWPGNVRELENSIEHAVLLCAADEQTAGTPLGNIFILPYLRFHLTLIPAEFYSRHVTAWTVFIVGGH
jgi:Nif-specific regulatory protein